MEEIQNINTHTYEDGRLLYNVRIYNSDDGSIRNEWVDAETVHHDFDVHNYWLKQCSLIPFSQEEAEYISIDEYDVVKEPNKKDQMFYSVKMEGNGLDEYHILSKKQMENVSDGKIAIIKFYSQMFEALK